MSFADWVMLNDSVRQKVDQVWNNFWSGGIANPLEVIEQITYLLFLRRLDEIQLLEEARLWCCNTPLERCIFPERRENCRWSCFRNMPPAEMFRTMVDEVFPFLRELGGEGSIYAQYMRDAQFKIPTPALLGKVVDMLADIPMDNRDTKGDLYEYMLSKLASSGQNGQFRTPRHIIQLIVELTAPTPEDVIVDPACGTAGFLVAANEYIRESYPNALLDQEKRKHFHNAMFHGFDFDNTMLRIGSMNMLLHGVDNPDIRYRDSLSEDHMDDAGSYSLILANPPFAGSLDADSVAKDLRSVVKTRKTELLFLALFLRLLKHGGRAAVIVPDGVLFGSSKAHKVLRKTLVEDQKLDAVISLPSGVFRPYAGVSCTILFFTRTDSGGTEDVWFYDMQADGWSLDDKRQPLLPAERLGPCPSLPLSAEEHIRNNLPDIRYRWEQRYDSERDNPRTAQSFTVSKDEIAGTGYDLSLNRYKEVIRKEVEHRAPAEILQELYALESEISVGLTALEGMLS